MKQIFPDERIGHFGFFRDKMQTALWPQVPQWLCASAAH